MRDKTMKLIKSTALATALAILCSNAMAIPLDLQEGGAPKLKATKIQLGIKAPAGNACPGIGTFNAWIFTNKPGTIPILIVAKNGNVSGPYMVETKKGANGLSMGTYQKPLNVAQPINTAYRVVTPNSTVSSGWVPLAASC
jgi:hypothetical protein